MTLTARRLFKSLVSAIKLQLYLAGVRIIRLHWWLVQLLNLNSLVVRKSQVDRVAAGSLGAS